MTSWRPPGSILEAPDSILEAPKLDLGRFWHDFFEILGQNAKKAKNAKNACQNKTSITNPPRVGGRRCSPPRGVSMKFSTVFGFVSSKWSLHRQTAKNAKKAKNAKNAQTAKSFP